MAGDATGMRAGVIGLGAMGLGIAQSLRRAQFDVRVFDVRGDAAQAFARDGGSACATAAQLAASCDVVVSAVVNAAQTEEVLFGEGGAAAAMRQGSAFMMCSTVDPNWSSALEGRLAERGLLYLDAPMSGGAAKAAAGELTMMTAGRPEAYAKCQPVLDAMAARVYRMGDRAGAGSKMKIVHQLLAGVHIAAAAEAMALGLREGVDPKRFMR
jgi:L-threonate 2-dehydrogenase